MGTQWGLEHPSHHQPHNSPYCMINGSFSPRQTEFILNWIASIYRIIRLRFQAFQFVIKLCQPVKMRKIFLEFFFTQTKVTQSAYHVLSSTAEDSLLYPWHSFSLTFGCGWGGPRIRNQTNGLRWNLQDRDPCVRLEAETLWQLAIPMFL